MGWTKQQFIEQAMEEVGLASYVYDLTPDQLNSALRRLDSMISTWNIKGILLGFPLTTRPQDSSLSTEVDIPLAANEAIFLNLGLRIAPSFGKTVSIETKTNARSSYMALLSEAAAPRESQMPAEMPAGAGNRNHLPRRKFLNKPDKNPIRHDGQLVITEN